MRHSTAAVNCPKGVAVVIHCRRGMYRRGLLPFSAQDWIATAVRYRIPGTRCLIDYVRLEHGGFQGCQVLGTPTDTWESGAFPQPKIVLKPEVVRLSHVLYRRFFSKIISTQQKSGIAPLDRAYAPPRRAKDMSCASFVQGFQKTPRNSVPTILCCNGGGITCLCLNFLVVHYQVPHRPSHEKELPKELSLNLRTTSKKLDSCYTEVSVGNTPF